MFSDEAYSYLNGEVNKQNLRYWSKENPHWFTAIKERGAKKIMAWVAVWEGHIFGPFFFDTSVTAENYLTMLGNELMPELDGIGGRPAYFMQDGAPPHYAHFVRQWLDIQFPNSWTGRRVIP